MIEITDFRDSLLLTMSAVPMGDDLCVALYGGDKAHIGAVAIGQPRPSLDDPAVTSATTSVIAVIGHKEDMLARRLALRLAATLKVVVTVSCGIHVEAVTAADIETIGALAMDMAEELIAEVILRRNAAREAPGGTPLPPAGQSGHG
ncbi:hypothetical protein [Desulfolutivibrio sulfoxidireducens]|uniref:prenylated flavin chaperone LpdD n=1 Tax=Desulfolutivibrio sulfoxidireducens TaxID=2773299 RepID=UPI00159E1B94|nr:hypothetical protein [Desulfolutivibrio sulfoxidireducens]QLA19777.1 hypothetical protein GD604_08535 [Desulfolutivibrio sulfoxidireducens]